MYKKNTTVRIKDEFNDILKDLSKATGIPVQKIVDRALDKLMDAIEQDGLDALYPPNKHLEQTVKGIVSKKRDES